jgi:hypothetical protein
MAFGWRDMGGGRVDTPKDVITEPFMSKVTIPKKKHDNLTGPRSFSCFNKNNITLSG